MISEELQDIVYKCDCRNPYCQHKNVQLEVALVVAMGSDDVGRMIATGSRSVFNDEGSGVIILFRPGADHSQLSAEIDEIKNSGRFHA